MRPFTWVFALLAILMAGLFVFGWAAVRYDPKQFQLSMEQELSRRWGVTATFENISVAGRFPPALVIRGFTLHTSSGDMLAKSDRIFLKPLWGPWIFQRLVISEAEIRNPDIYLKRTSDGRWNWDLDFIKPARPLAQNGKLSILSWRIREGSLHFLDESSKSRFHFTLSGLSTEPHSGRLDTPLRVIMAPAKAAGSAGGVATWDLQHRVLTLQAEDPAGTLRLNAEIYQENALIKESFSLHFINRPVAAESKDFVLSGSLDGLLKGSSQGTDSETFFKHLKASFHVSLKNGTYRPVNLPQTVLVKIARIPSFGSLIDPPFPPDLREVLTRSDTAFSQLEADFELKGGLLRTQNMRLRQDAFTLFGGGQFEYGGGGLDLDLAFRPSPLLGTFMLSRVPELDALVDSSGEITIPFQLKGSLVQPALEMPLKQIGKRLVELRGEELAARGYQTLNEFLEIPQ